MNYYNSFGFIWYITFYRIKWNVTCFIINICKIIVLIIIILNFFIVNFSFAAGSSGSSGNGNSSVSKTKSQYEYASSIIKKAKKLEEKGKVEKAKKNTKEL